MGARDEQTPAPEDPWDAFARANTREDVADGDATPIALEFAIVQCERAYGASWYYAPHRWPTSDGFVPYKLVWIYWRALQANDAAHALSTARGIGLAFGDGEPAERHRSAAIRQAFGSPKG